MVFSVKEKKIWLMGWSRMQGAEKELGVPSQKMESQPRTGQPSWEGSRERSWPIIHKRRSIWGRGNSSWTKIELLKNKYSCLCEVLKNNLFRSTAEKKKIEVLKILRLKE